MEGRVCARGSNGIFTIIDIDIEKQVNTRGDREREEGNT